jgi:uncharacterized protein (TIGR02594 family)
MELIRRRATWLLCVVALAGFAGSAAARPAHKAKNHLHAASTPHDVRSADGQPYPFVDGQGETAQAVAAQGRRASTKSAKLAHHASDAFGGFTSNSLVSEARKYIGTNPTGRGSLWCGAFMDMVLKHSGYKGGGNLAKAYAHYGTRISGPQVGAIAVMSRNGGGHVGIVSGIDPNGNPIIISGNHHRTTAESVYPAGRIMAYVMPNG